MTLMTALATVYGKILVNDAIENNSLFLKC